MKRMNKKGEGEVLNITVVYLLLNLIFFAAMFGFVAVSISNTALTEQINAKRIAFIIDNAEPGMNITIKLEKLYEAARKNGYGDLEGEEVVEINNEENQVIVKTKKNTKYAYKYYTKLRKEPVIIGGDGRTFIKIQI